jgi:hypothetical protein
MNYWIRPMFFNNKIKKEEKEIQVIKKACEIFEVSIDDLNSKRRFRNIVEVRYVLFYIFHKKLNYTLHQTSNIFNKNHATALHGCKVVKNISEYDYQFNSKLKVLIDFAKYGFCSNDFLNTDNKKSMYRGISWNKKARKWQVHIFENGKNKYLGRFKNEYEAHLTYERKRKQIKDKRFTNN